MSITTKYTVGETAIPPPGAFRGVTKTLQHFLLTLFRTQKTVWMVRGLDTAQLITVGGTYSINEMLVSDRFQKGYYEVLFIGGFSSVLAGSAATIRFTLDGSTALGDHTSQWVSLDEGTTTPISFLVDLLNLTEGAHTIGLEVFVAAPGGLNIDANRSTLMVRQL